MTMNKILVSQPHVDSLMQRDNVLDVFFPMSATKSSILLGLQWWTVDTWRVN